MAMVLSLSQLGWTELQGGDSPEHRDAAAKDADGVEKLYPDAPGLALGLGREDLNRLPNFTVDHGLRFRRKREGNISFWTAPTYDFQYASGGRGKTARVHIRANEVAQRYTWRDAPEYLTDPLDLGSQEFTAYVRVRGIHDPERAAISLKIRGGEHTQRAPAHASCTMMTFASRRATAVSRFGKELDHPNYDYVTLPLRFDTELREGQWLGLKLVSVQSRDGRRVTNRLYVDERPFDNDGSPRNDFRLLSEYIDQHGESTGRYHTVVNWAGSASTLRVDGVDALDVAILSVRAVEPGNRKAASR